MAEYVNDREAAAFAGVSVSLFRKLRLTGGGPPVYKIGECVRYSLREIEEWIKGRRVTAAPEVSR